MNQCFGCNTCASVQINRWKRLIRELPMETSHHRVEGQSTKCGFGLQGVCTVFAPMVRAVLRQKHPEESVAQQQM